MTRQFEPSHLCIPASSRAIVYTGVNGPAQPVLDGPSSGHGLMHVSYGTVAWLAAAAAAAAMH